MELRKCAICGKIMFEGFCVNDGEKYYCSEECLHKDYSEKEWQEMYDNDNVIILNGKKKKIKNSD